MDLFFSQPRAQISYAQGLESAWLDMGIIAVASNHISIGDAILFPGDQADLEVTNGLYTVQAKGIDYGNDRRISRLRAFRNQSVFEYLRLTRISVDFGVVGVCDSHLFLQALERNTGGGKDLALYKGLYSDPLNAPYGMITLDSANMIFVNPGWGDGQYDVFQLQADGDLLGIEAAFIDTDSLASES